MQTIESPLAAQVDSLKAELTSLGGAACVRDDDATRTLFSQDIWSESEHLTALVVTPESTAQLASMTRIITTHGFVIAPRGGGMSYTGGYLPQAAQSVTVDFGRMNRVLAVRADDMTVTVEAGCTWLALYEKLQPMGLRTPFWGPLSGFSSTIGGGLSQLNAIFGSGHYGTTSESVVSVSIVLADGSVLRTGAGGDTPFFRHFGPDLTGLFCGDGGIFGLKAEITLRLMRLPPHEASASFAFATRDECVAGITELARSGVACEAFGFDPQLAQVRLRRASLMSDLKTLAAVAGQQTSRLRGAAQAAKIALSGRDFIGEDEYSVHLVCEGRSAGAVDADLAAARTLMGAAGGKEIANTLPQVMRARPFTPLNNILGPGGERWVPIHGIVSLSKAAAVCADIDAIFAELRPQFAELGVSHGYLYTTLSTNAFLVEPVFFWHERHLALHRATVDSGVLARMPEVTTRPGARALVELTRRRIIDTLSDYGAAHFQIARTYPYRRTQDPATLELLDAIKKTLDPRRLMNPGALEQE